MDNTVPHSILKGNPKQFYVYTLAYPESMGAAVFYVGKGTQYTNGVDRIDMHELEASSSVRHRNANKIKAIKDIVSRGEEVVKQKIAYFGDELEAYMYEWAIMNMTAYADSLLNIDRGGGYPRAYEFQERRKAFPILAEEEYKHHGGKHWGCFKSPTGRIFHEVVDLDSFAKVHRLNEDRVRSLAAGRLHITKGWTISHLCPSRGINLRDIITYESSCTQPWDDNWER